MENQPPMFGGQPYETQPFFSNEQWAYRLGVGASVQRPDGQMSGQVHFGMGSQFLSSQNDPIYTQQDVEEQPCPAPRKGRQQKKVSRRGGWSCKEEDIVLC